MLVFVLWRIYGAFMAHFMGFMGVFGPYAVFFICDLIFLLYFCNVNSVCADGKSAVGTQNSEVRCESGTVPAAVISSLSVFYGWLKWFEALSHWPCKAEKAFQSGISQKTSI